MPVPASAICAAKLPAAKAVFTLQRSSAWAAIEVDTEVFIWRLELLQTKYSNREMSASFQPTDWIPNRYNLI